MTSSTDPTAQAQSIGPTTADKLFLVFLALVVIAIAWLGVSYYQEANKTEVAKNNAEAWVRWLTKTGSTRFNANTPHPACKGGGKPIAEATAGAPGTWGACLTHIRASTPLKDQINLFSNVAPHFVAACVPSDRTLKGALLLENLTPPASGAAPSLAGSPLLESDPINGKMQLRLSVCDTYGYAIEIAQFEF